MTNKPQFEQPALECLDSDAGADSAEIAQRLGAEVAARFGPRDETPLSVLARDASGALIGGLNGATHWRWLYVRHLWVAEARRGEGLGRALLAQAEACARRRDCIGVYIDTFEPAAAAFYERAGFARFGEIADFPHGSRRMFLSKRLDAK